VHLKSLTLKGFKSFATPTSFVFEPGVTCIIGPNGSGKSNVVDALAWVMGEQGAKSLRGGKMEDVIFAGTATKAPLGRAEVQLTIDNSDGALPIEYTEVTIGRTLFRNGQSEYAINGESCRLLDVQELLSDSGLGREMHVIIGQGQLDRILHASAEERRGFIEEAAGILKHRRRKEKTLRKLEAMQANLTRLNDLSGELRRQLKPLGQQAQVARQAQAIAAIVRDAKARLLADDVAQLRAALAAASQDEQERATERMVLQEQLEQAAQRRQRLEAEVSSVEVDEARRISFALEAAQQRIRGLTTLAMQRQALLATTADESAATSGVTEAEVQEARDAAKALEAEAVAAQALVAEAAATVAAAKGALDAVDDEIAAQSALISQHELALGKLAGAVQAAESRLAALRGQAERQQRAYDEAGLRREHSRTLFTALEAETDQSVDGDQGLNEAYEAAEAQVAAGQAALEALREALHAAERERDAYAARVSALGMALGQRDGTTDLAERGLPGIRGRVAESVTVQPGYEAAIAAALGTLADALLADDFDSAAAAVQAAMEAELGRGEVVVAEPTGSTALPGLDLPAGLRAANDLVTAPSGVRLLLAATAVADDLESARRAWQGAGDRLPESLTVITRTGEVLTRTVLRGGTGSARSRIELAAERDQAQVSLLEATTTIERLTVEIAEAKEALQQAREAAKAALTALREHDSEVAARTEQLGRLRLQFEAAQQEQERLAVTLEEAREAVRTAEQALDRARAEHDEYAALPKPMLDASSRDALVVELEAARAAELEQRVALETLRERARAEAARAASLQRQREAERARAEEAARQAVLRRRRLEAAESVLAALPAVQQSVDRSLVEARMELERQEASRREQHEELGRVREEEVRLRERLSQITERVHGLELQIHEKRLHLSQLLDRAANELGLGEAVLIAEYGPNQPVPMLTVPDVDLASLAESVREAAAESEAQAARDDDEEAEQTATDSADQTSDEVAPTEAGTVEIDGEVYPTQPYVREEQQRRLADAERKLSRLGRVNPLALEEFAALEQRHKFLTEQLQDLQQTRRDLLAIVEELDTTMQTIFMSAFEDTRAAFAEVFPLLFPGGTGSIALTDPDSPLTTGIEVTVRPAGKKIERLSLLSGGERSLAAVAFLVAIFTARPSPFYILDEVEAALDDANLGRLLTVLERLRENSQLIVITHQKRTMEIADALYGVSMRQDGISAVVGQRVSDEALR